MQIKRFEAADMTEALRMVKREFGADAVILSAREVRSGGFLGALRKKRVEITAAADYATQDPHDGATFNGVLAQELNETESIDRVSLSRTQPPTAAEGSKIESPVPTDHLIANPFYRDASGRKIVALVGSPGVGKSTAVAKLAWHCHVVEKRRVGLISLDRFRFAANGLLESIACVLHLPLKLVYDADDLSVALGELEGVDIVLVDTPGMGASDPSMMEQVRQLLDMAAPCETHLVVNATVRCDIRAAAVKLFMPAGVNRLLFTHMDECGSDAALCELLQESRLPASFLTDGVDLFDHLQEASLDRLRPLRPAGQAPRRPRSVFPAVDPHRPARPPVASCDAAPTMPYVANRNSELFHHAHCKSVKLINTENIAAFNSIEQAIDEGYKPCRTCCDSGVLKKSITGAVGRERTAAIPFGRTAGHAQF